MITDAQKDPKDALPAEGQPSGDKPQEPSAPETYTKEQAEKLADEKHAKLDKQIANLEKTASRSAAAVEAAERRAKAAEEAMAETEKAKDAAALKAAGDNPDALSLYQARVAVREAQADVKAEKEQLEADKREHAAEIEDAKSYKVMKLANEIGAELNVDANQLVSLTDGTEEKMRKAAEILPKVGQPRTTTIPDSGGGTGGAKKLSEMNKEELDKMSDEEYFKRREAGEKI